MECIEDGCSKPRGGRNTVCWMHLKRKARLNKAIRAFQSDIVMNEDISESVLTTSYWARGAALRVDENPNRKEG